MFFKKQIIPPYYGSLDLFSIESGTKAIPIIVRVNDKANETIMLVAENFSKNPDVKLVTIAIWYISNII
jgi:hypothetical protein